MKNNWFTILFLILTIYVSATLSSDIDREIDKQKSTRKSRFSKDLDIDALEKSWESGDSEDELELEHEYQRKISSKKSQQNSFDPSNPKKFADAISKDPTMLASSGGGTAALFFVDLVEKQSNGKPWTKQAVDFLSSKWSDLMKSGNIPCLVYNIGDDKDVGRLLINVEKSWRAGDAVKFVLSQPETDKLTKDSKEYTRKDFLLRDDDEDEDEDDL